MSNFHVALSSYDHRCVGALIWSNAIVVAYGRTMHSTTTSTIAVSQDWTLIMQCQYRRGAFFAAMVQALASGFWKKQTLPCFHYIVPYFHFIWIHWVTLLAGDVVFNTFIFTSCVECYTLAGRQAIKSSYYPQYIAYQNMHNFVSFLKYWVGIEQKWLPGDVFKFSWTVHLLVL